MLLGRKEVRAVFDLIMGHKESKSRWKQMYSVNSG